MKKRIFLLFIGASLMVPALSGQGIFSGFSNKEAPKITETNYKTLLDGFWVGEGSQLGTKWVMELYYDTFQERFVIKYPTVPCSGNWQIVKVSPKVLVLKETITKGGENWTKECEVRVRFVNENEVKMEFYEINGLIPLAKASLTKKSPLTIEQTIFKTFATGYWEGQIGELLIQLRYDTLNRKIAVNYPTLECEGAWRIMISDGYLVFDGTSEGNKCDSGFVFAAEYNDENSLNLFIYKPNTSEPFASGTILKKDKFTKIEVPKHNPAEDNKSISERKTDLQNKNLNGKVKSVTEKIGSNTWKYYYNEQGMLSKYEDLDGIVEYTYDNEGLLTNRKIILPKGSLGYTFEREHYQKSENRTFVYNEKKQLIESRTNEEKIVYTYDNKGFLIKSQRFCNDKSIEYSPLLYFYDSKGNLTTVHMGEVSSYPHQEYKYDEKGRVILKKEPETTFPANLSYNDKNDVIKETGKDWEDLDYISISTYTYDSKNNWTKRTTKYTTKYFNKDETVTSYTTRTITYFE